MSGVMHPVGPEPSETYWLRRALLAGALLVLVIIVLLFVFNLRSPTGQAAPSGSGTPVVPEDSASATTKPSTKSSPTSTSTAQSTAKADKTEPTDKSSDKPTAKGDKAGDKSSDKPEDKSSDKAEDKSSGKPENKSSDKADKQTDKTTKSKKTAEPENKQPVKTCDPKELRATLKGDSHTAKVGKSVDFELTLINGGNAPCRLEVGGDNFELKIYSGTDRIWSSNDCRKVEPRIEQTVAPEKSVLWTMEWNGERSRKGAECKAGSETPRPGYYYATSQYRGADPVQFLVVLK